MSNHLSEETSPYLLQHKDNPVEWYAWNDEALKKTFLAPNANRSESSVMTASQ